MFTVLVLFMAFLNAIFALTVLLNLDDVWPKVVGTLIFGFTAYLLVSYALLLGW
jgi:hypothetical protein